MNRQEKEQVVQVLKASFADSQASFLVNYQGLTVGQLQALRKELRNNGASFKVAKARLMKIAVQDVSGVDFLAPYLKEQVGLVFAKGEAPAVAKVLVDYSREFTALKLVAGGMESQLLTGASITALASLPSRDVLLAMVCGTLKAPIVKLDVVLNMLILRLLFVLKQVAEKKEAN
ncbi:MAG: 50S ribosomal protein L10 [candidate division TM6 bacterium GW2011_GWF2_32_72]|nr:MAG: 50S ribosomal protein L10 [candidate division TM6 bacterium GW2011_GWF2_32_72]